MAAELDGDNDDVVAAMDCFSSDCYPIVQVEHDHLCAKKGNNKLPIARPRDNVMMGAHHRPAVASAVLLPVGVQE